MKTILVTGAAGFIGSHTVDKILAEDCRVVGVDNFRTGRRENLQAALRNSAFTLYEGDISVDGTLDALVARTSPDAIIHLAALVSVPESIANPELNHRLNLHASYLVAEAARRHHVPRVVYASSAAVYGNAASLPLEESSAQRPISPYGAAKLASEILLIGYGESFGMTVRCQRYFNVYGPRQDPSSPYSGVISIFLEKFSAGKPVTILGDGGQTRDFIAVADVARANALAALSPNLRSGTANICTGKQVSLLQILDIFAAQFPNAPKPVFAPRRTGDIAHSLGDPTRAQNELHFSAEIPVETGLSELIRLSR